MAQFLVERGRQPHLVPAGIAQHQVISTANRQAMVAGLGDGSGRARLDALGAEEAAAEIERDRLVRRAC